MRSQRRSLLDLESTDDEQPESDNRSILGLSRGAAPVKPQATAPKPSAPPRAPSRAEARPADHPPESLSDVPVPEFERDLEDRGRRPIPFERAVLFSMAAHLLFLLFILLAPAGAFKGKGLLAAFMPSEEPKDNIPIVFREAPGPARENPKNGEMSDKTRRAGGGDPSKSKADTPFVPARPGPEGIAPGPRGSQRSAPAQAPAPPAPPQIAEKGPAAAPGERFPSAADALPVPPPGATSSGQKSGLTNLDSAIRDAAKAAAGAGQNGGGFPNPDGGFVDSGPLSFDTKWYDWGPYAEEMVRRIKLHWDIPELARLGWKGRLTIRFFIMADGRVEAAHIISQSGIPPFDFAALQAILKSNPFRPLPKDLLAQVPGKDREGITVTFFYNMRPEDERGK